MDGILRVFLGETVGEPPELAGVNVTCGSDGYIFVAGG